MERMRGEPWDSVGDRDSVGESVGDWDSVGDWEGERRTRPVTEVGESEMVNEIAMTSSSMSR